MSKEGQLQAGLAWAIPRFIEDWNEVGRECIPPRDQKTWVGLYPPSTSQSSDDFTAMGMDLLALIGASRAIVLELKCAIHGKFATSVVFQPGQLKFLQSIGAGLPTYVCCDTNSEQLTKEIEPSAAEAQRYLKETQAVEVGFFPQHRDARANLRLALEEQEKHQEFLRQPLFEPTLLWVLKEILDDQKKSEEAETDISKLIDVSSQIQRRFAETGQYPPNLYFLFVAKASVRCVSAVGLARLCDVLLTCEDPYLITLADAKRRLRKHPQIDTGGELSKQVEAQGQKLIAVLEMLCDPARPEINSQKAQELIDLKLDGQHRALVDAVKTFDYLRARATKNQKSEPTSQKQIPEK